MRASIRRRISIGDVMRLGSRALRWTLWLRGGIKPWRTLGGPMSLRICIACTLVLGTLGLAACASDDAAQAPGPAPISSGPSLDVDSPRALESEDLMAIANEAGTFRTLVTAVAAAGLVEALQGDEPYTVFAPTDDAFESLPAGRVDAWMTDPMQVKELVNFHVVEGKLLASDLEGITTVNSIHGEELVIDTSGDGIRIGQANVIEADIEARNGVIHVIDRVLKP